MKTINIERCTECPHGKRQWVKHGMSRMDKVLTCELLNGPSNRRPRTYFVIRKPNLGIPKECKLEGDIENEVESEVEYS